MTTTTWENSPERPAAPEPAGDDANRWPPWSAPMALITVLIVSTVGGLVVAIVATGFGYEFGSGSSPPGVVLPSTFLLDASFAAIAIVFARLAAPVAAQQFGLQPTRMLAAIGWMAAAYAAFIVFFQIWSQIVQLDGAKDQVDGLGAKDSEVALVFSALLVCVMAPIAEEFFFRGFFFRALKNWRGLWPAAILTGLVFGGIHLGSAEAGALMPLAFFGFVLCVLREKTGSLYPPIALHAFNNAVAFGSAVGWSWEIPLLIAGAMGGSLAVARAGAQAFPGRPVVD